MKNYGFEKIGSPGMRGMLNFWIISLLNRKQMNGYEIAKEISEITGSYWKPTTGSLYPALHKLKKNGIIKELRKGKRKQVIYTLTPYGKSIVNKMKEKMMLHIRSPKSRRVFDSLLWPNESKEITNEIDRMHQYIIELRSSLNRKNSRIFYNILRKINSMLERMVRN